MDDFWANRIIVVQQSDEYKGRCEYHLVMSANAIGEKKRHSLKRHEFTRIRHDMERICNERYPELEQGCRAARH